MCYFCNLFIIIKTSIQTIIKKMKKDKKQYESPIIEILDARVEKGFLLSTGNPANTQNEDVDNSGRTYMWN